MMASSGYAVTTTGRDKQRRGAGGHLPKIDMALRERTRKSGQTYHEVKLKIGENPREDNITDINNNINEEIRLIRL